MMDDSKIPRLAGYKEAMDILNWGPKKRSMINTYMKRGKFPIPIQTLASGPIWTEEQIIEFRDSRAAKE